MTMQIAICDDEIVLLPELTSMIEACFRKHRRTIDPHSFSTSADLLRQIRTGTRFSCYFLDIDIPECDGIALAEKIRMIHPDAKIIYVSARDERVFDTFRTQPLSFVRKSHFREELSNAVDMLIATLEPKPDTIIPFRDELNHETALNISRILYVEANQKYQRVVSLDGSELIRCTINDLEKTLVPHRFVRIHRGYIVNLRYIYRIDTKQITLDDKTILPLSRNRFKDVQQTFMDISRIAKE